MKHYLIYKTICTITDRYYIGMHETPYMKDGYLGSGKILKASINKYGKENHIRTILHALNSRDEMIAKEIEIVTENLLKDVLCMNLTTGGHGGSNGPHTEEIKRRLSEQKKGQKGTPHTEEHKAYMSKVHMGKPKPHNTTNNKGRRLITNGADQKYLYKDQELPQGWKFVSSTEKVLEARRVRDRRRYANKKKQ